MANGISLDNEQFIQQQIASGAYRHRDEVVDAALAVFRRREQLLRIVDEGRRQLDEGECSEYDDESLSQRFDDLKQRALKNAGAGQPAR